ncbi:hypothetical protein [Roseateles koreensis]|uniref:SPOR domain-containing protein n=1 Tax=Roseateles koreensis TaxID=2987526 RepID=A0ABT5KWN6_9BURK|nr:hypothetical protein [Roseateles koreensis]MDC8787227.1 hypothetical protein [Roseateles koreensis]
MLRALLLILLLLNALFFAWTRGWLDDVVGIKARGDHEPERAARQLYPERVQVLSPQALAAARAQEPRVCLELGPLLGDAALQTAQSALARAGVTPTEFQPQHSNQPGVWAVATIKLSAKEFQQRKEDTYRKMKINFEYLQDMPTEMPSLILSRHDSEKAANAQLAALDRRSLKGLRVLQLQAPMIRHSLLVPQADEALRAKLAELSKDPALAPGFKACLAVPNNNPAQTETAASGAASAASAAAPTPSSAASGR